MNIMNIRLERTGGGPNPDTDDCYRLLIDDEIITNYGTRGDVLRLVNRKLEELMTKTEFTNGSQIQTRR